MLRSEGKYICYFEILYEINFTDVISVFKLRSFQKKLSS